MEGKFEGDVSPEGYGKKKSKELSPEAREKIKSLNTRLQVVEALFKLAPENAFNEALRELALQPKEKNVSDEEKDLLKRYKNEIMKLIAIYYNYLPPEKKKLFEELCIGILKK